MVYAISRFRLKDKNMSYLSNMSSKYKYKYALKT
jgi:hypothetical protein